MDTLARIFADGGPFALLVTIAGLLAIPVALLPPLVFGLAKWRAPASLGWLGPLAVLVLGAIGAAYGVSQAESAVAVAPPEMKQTMLAAGISIALYVTALAAPLAGAAFVAAAVGGTIPALATPGPEPRLDLLGPAGGLGFGLVAAGLAVGAGLAVVGLEGTRTTGVALPALILLTLFVAALPLVAALRVPAEDPEHRGRIAGLRLFIGASGYLAVVVAADGWEVLGTIEAFQAVASAPPELKSELMRMGLEIAGYASTWGWALALVPLLAGLGTTLPLLRDVGVRQGVGAAVAAVVALATLGSLGLAGSLWSGLMTSLLGTVPG